MEVAVQLLKKGKSAGVDNIPAELVQAGRENIITTLTKSATKFGKQENGQHCGPSSWSSHYQTSQERQPAAVPELLNDQPHQLPKESHAEDHT